MLGTEEKRYGNLEKNPEHHYRAVIGFSMGGFGALEYLSKFPDMFCCGVSLDGALFDWADMIARVPDVASDMFNSVESNFIPYSVWDNVTINADAISGRIRQVVSGIRIPKHSQQRSHLWYAKRQRCGTEYLDGKSFGSFRRV